MVYSASSLQFNKPSSFKWELQIYQCDTVRDMYKRGAATQNYIEEFCLFPNSVCVCVCVCFTACVSQCVLCSSC